MGSYTVSTRQTGSLSTSELTLDLGDHPEITGYSITYGDNNIYTSDKLSIQDSFSYLTLLIVSLDQVEVSFYNDNGDLLYTGSFHSEDQTVWGLATE